MNKLVSTVLMTLFVAMGCGGSEDCENPSDNPNGPACLDDVSTLDNAGSDEMNTGATESTESTESPSMEESMENMGMNSTATEEVIEGDEAGETEEVIEGDEAGELEEEVVVEGTGYCSENPATEPGTMCASILMPADAAGNPEKVSFHFFASVPPLGPPTLMGLELAMPSELEGFTPGSEVPMLLENLPSEGELFLYTALYMEGGGATTWQAVAGVDYIGDKDIPISLTGEPINITEPITVMLAE